MIKTVKLKFGKHTGAPPQVIETSPITIFVGPNNSGKSRVLSEINHYCGNGIGDITDVILENIDFDTMPAATAAETVRIGTLAPIQADTVQDGYIAFGRPGATARIQVPRDRLIAVLQRPNDDKPLFCQAYLRLYVLPLSGRGRIDLINAQSAGDLQHPASYFQVLFTDNAKRKEVRRIVHDAFGSYLVVDPTGLGHLRLRLSPREPVDETEERGIHDAAIQFHANALQIEATSDGVKAFTGIIIAIVAGDPSVITMDEPEAFLHPSLAFNLGKEIGRAMSGLQKRLFVSTHSADFVMGCIQSAAPLNIVRLTYQEGVATARILPSQAILRLMRNPLLRSIGVLNGLFYKFVVVAESDADRAFYQEINERLLQFMPDFGIPNCLFINAQNKQTVQIIIRPLRELGIPAACIVDIDILKDGGLSWRNFLESGFIPQIERESLGQMRGQIKQKFDESGKNMAKDGGVEILSESDKEAANNLLDRLADYGLFVVRRGEVESWLPRLNAQGHGPTWLIDIFEKMGEDPASTSFLRPSVDDVWHFIANIKRWLANPDRKGIP